MRSAISISGYALEEEKPASKKIAIYNGVLNKWIKGNHRPFFLYAQILEGLFG